MRAGVRQGCPLSGLLFAICVDVLLQNIARALGSHEILRAYADDSALVIKDYRKSAPAIAIVFKEFAQISALELNIRKTVFIPLWPFSSSRNVRLLIREMCYLWKDIEIDNKGKLLGIFIGPGADHASWSKPLGKFEQRVAHWSRQHMGLH